MHAEKCPVCGGSGHIADYNDTPQTTSASVNYRTCHGCGGKGWVLVPGYPSQPWQPTMTIEWKGR